MQDVTGFQKKDIKIVIDTFIGIIHEDVLIQGKQVRLTKFGTFKQKILPVATRRNPRTGNTMECAGSHTVTFKPSRSAFKIKRERTENVNK